MTPRPKQSVNQKKNPSVRQAGATRKSWQTSVVAPSDAGLVLIARTSGIGLPAFASGFHERAPKRVQHTLERT